MTAGQPHLNLQSTFCKFVCTWQHTKYSGFCGSYIRPVSTQPSTKRFQMLQSFIYRKISFMIWFCEMSFGHSWAPTASLCRARVNSESELVIGILSIPTPTPTPAKICLSILTQTPVKTAEYDRFGLRRRLRLHSTFRPFGARQWPFF